MQSLYSYMLEMYGDNHIDDAIEELKETIEKLENYKDYLEDPQEEENY